MSERIQPRYESRRVAITGASGYLAGALLPELVRAKANVLRVSRGALQPVPGTECLLADLRNGSSWDQIISFADIVFHLSSNTSVYAAEENPAASLDSTLLPVLHMAQSARRARRRPRVVLAGTATQYGLTTVVPVSEETPSNPITNYDLHKLFAERQLLVASQQGFLDGVSLRLANVYGPSGAQSRASDRGVINQAAAAALAGQPLKIFGGERCLRDYVYIADVVRAFLAVGLSEGAYAGSVFNVGSGAGVTVRDAFEQIASEAARVTGKTVPVETTAWPPGSHAIERRDFVADTSALHAATGWSPQVSFKDGVARLISELRAAS